MLRRTVIAGLVLGTLLLVLFFTPTGEVISQSIRHVFVTNFPEVQKVEGEVQLASPVRLASSVKFEDITVPPIPRHDTTRLVEAGTLETEGFPEVILSLHGVVKGHVAKPGKVGVILIPEEQTIAEAFREQGMMHFFMETVAGDVSSKTPYFASSQPRYSVAFSRYRILLYNTTDKTVSANLYAYLTN